MSKRKYDEAIEELEKLCADAESNFKAESADGLSPSERIVQWNSYISGIKSSIYRLEMGNTVVPEAAPRVSEEQIAALKDANEQLVRIRASREERAERLGIPPATTLELAQTYAEEHGLVLCYPVDRASMQIIEEAAKILAATNSPVSF